MVRGKLRCYNGNFSIIFLTSCTSLVGLINIVNYSNSSSSYKIREK